MEKLNVTLRLQWLTCDPLRFKLRFKRFTALVFAQGRRRLAASVPSAARNSLFLSYIITSQRIEKFNKRIYKGSLSVCQRQREREMTANKIRSHQMLSSQKGKKCPICYSALSFMCNGDLRSTSKD